MKKVSILLVVSIFSIGTINAQQRIVLLEQFTNSGCPPCATSTPTVLNYVDANPNDVVAIAYHTSFPYNDSMYYENPTQSNTRTSYYGVGGVPHTVIDGNYYSNGSPAFIPVMASTINTRKAIPEGYDIIGISNTISSGVLNSQINFSSLLSSNVNDSLRAFIVVIEKVVLKNSYAASPGANSETQYEYVMRKMITTDSGAYLQNRNLAGTDMFNINWTLSKIKNINEVRIVAFVQNKNTKEVYQSVLFTPSLLSSVEENDVLSTKIVAYPNPSENILNVDILNSFYSVGEIELSDIFGRVVYSEKIDTRDRHIIELSQFSKGLYFLNFKTSERSISKKVVLK